MQVTAEASPDAAPAGATSVPAKVAHQAVAAPMEAAHEVTLAAPEFSAEAAAEGGVLLAEGPPSSAIQAAPDTPVATDVPAAAADVPASTAGAKPARRRRQWGDVVAPAEASPSPSAPESAPPGSSSTGMMVLNAPEGGVSDEAPKRTSRWGTKAEGEGEGGSVKRRRSRWAAAEEEEDPIKVPSWPIHIALPHHAVPLCNIELLPSHNPTLSTILP
jgi:hypothetical protein